MILTEWNTEDAIAFARNEGREAGLEEGHETGLEEGQNLVLELIEQVLSLEEIKLHLSQTANIGVK